MFISHNYKEIIQTIPEEVVLVAVSKTKPNSDILEAYQAGHRIFGENKVQEMVNKHEALPKDIQWHMIGHLQRNKVKYMAGFMVGISVLYGFFPGEGGDMVAHMCHLGGAVFGFIFHRYEGRYKRMVATVKERKERMTEEKAHEDEKEMDRLLSKIHEEGINSLSDKERKFLNEASCKYRKQR